MEEKNYVDVISFLPLLHIDCVHSQIIEFFQIALKRHKNSSQRNTKRQKVSYSTPEKQIQEGKQDKQEEEQEIEQNNNMDTNEDQENFNQIISQIEQYGLQHRVTKDISIEEMLTSSIILRSIICILLPYKDSIPFKNLLTELSDFIRLIAPQLSQVLLENFCPIFSVLFQAFFEVCKVIDVRQLEEQLTNIVLEILEFNWIDNIDIESSSMVKTFLFLINCLNILATLPSSYNVENRERIFLKLMKNPQIVVKKASIDYLTLFLFSSKGFFFFHTLKF